MRRFAELHILGNPLLRHDVLILSATLKEFTTRFQDMVTLGLVIAIPALLVRGAVWSLDLETRDLALLGAASLVALSLDVMLLGRLAYFRSDSALSPAALARGNRAQYRFVTHLVASGAVAAILCLPDPRATASFILSWWLSLIPIQLVTWASRELLRRGPSTQFNPVVRIWRSRAGGTGAVIMTLSGIAIVFVVGRYDRFEAAPVVAAFLSLCLLLWYSPVDHLVVNFERIIGHSPLRSVRTRLRIAALIAIALTVAAAASAGVRVLGAVLVVGTGVLIFRLIAVLLSRILARNQVQFFLAMALLIVLSVAFALPVATPVILLIFSAWLISKGRRTTWILA